MIEVRNLTKKYGDSTILDNVSTVINEGDVIAVIGPSGTGKSTFIRCLNMLNAPTSGQVFIDGEEITAPGADVNRLRRKVGMVFQQFNLFAHLTVIENVMIPQTDILGRSRQEAYEIAQKYLKMVGMSDRALRYPESLSGGQKQRAAIARTLAMDPEIILFDEPTSALDPMLVGEVEYIIEQLAREGRTMVIVTHEMSFARKVANRVFYMDEGGIYEEGTAEQIFTNPRKEKTGRFIRKTRTLDISMSPDGFDMPETVSRIGSFGESLGVSRTCIYGMQAVTEELCVQTILPRLEAGSILKGLIESSQNDDTVRMILEYDGTRIDLDKDMDPVARKLLEHAAEEIKADGNRIEIIIRK